MALLVSGILLFAAAHLFPAVLPRQRDRLSEKLGKQPYRGLLSVLVIAALILIVFGWKSAIPRPVYAPPLAPSLALSLLVLAGFVLFVASQAPGNIKRFIRHPQMAGTILWGVAHLLTNGDSRSLTLFGGLTAWAVIEVLAINRREGEWKKPAPASLRVDFVTVLIGVVAFFAMLYFHAALFGVAPTATQG